MNQFRNQFPKPYFLLFLGGSRRLFTTNLHIFVQIKCKLTISIFVALSAIFSRYKTPFFRLPLKIKTQHAPSQQNLSGPPTPLSG